MAREDAVHEGAAVVGELRVPRAPVALTEGAPDESTLLEFVDQEGDAAAADQDLLLDFAEEEPALVVEGVEDGELGFGEVVRGDVGAGVGVQGLGRPGEDDVQLEGCGGGWVGEHLSDKIN